jgi:hypothetical protein
LSKVLFNRETLLATGIDREKLSYEVEIDNVNVDTLTKRVSSPQKQPKEIDGKKVFLLPQKPTVNKKGVKYKVETVEETNEPVMEEIIVKVPLLDEDNNQITYEKKFLGETTEVTNAPVMYYDEELEKEVQKKDEEGNLLYIGLVPTGVFIDCFTTETDLVHKENKYGQKLFFEEKTDIVEEVVEVEPLVIVEDSEEYLALTEVELSQLVQDTEEVEVFHTVTFSEDFDQFSYEDVVKHKEGSIAEGTFYGEGKLYESFSPELFSTSLSDFNANIGFDFISIPSGGEVRTIKLPLLNESSLVGILVDSEFDDGLLVYIGSSASSLSDATELGEVEFSDLVSEVYVKFENTSDKTIDIKSFALLT